VTPTPDTADLLRPTRRGVLVAGAVGLGLAATGALAAPATARPRPGTQRLRVATYNIHHGAGPDDVLDLERIARAITAMDPDVVGLQEVDRHWGARSAYVDQAAWLAQRLGMHHVFAANLDLDPTEPGGERRQYGTALLSRHPILASRHTLLPLAPGGEQRGLLETTLTVRGVRVAAAVTHLTHNNNAERLDQARAIVGMLGEAPERRILVGDLNATAEKPEIVTLTDVLPDAWRAGTGDGFTMPVLDPTVRIDYILTSPDIRPVSAEVYAGDPTASDHLPVVTELSVPRVVGA